VENTVAVDVTERVCVEKSSSGEDYVDIEQEILAIEGYENLVKAPKKAESVDLIDKGYKDANQEADGFMNPTASPKRSIVSNNVCTEMAACDKIDLGNPAVSGFENPTAALKSVGNAASPIIPKKRSSKKFTAPLKVSKRLSKIKAASLVRMEDMVDFYKPAASKSNRDTAVIFIPGGYTY
jgi:hypothetical protein